MKNRTAPRKTGRRSNRTATSRQRGNALLAVIGVVGVLAALAVAYQATVQSQARTHDALAASIARQNAADAAASLGVWRIMRDWRADFANPAGTGYLCTQNGFSVRLRIEDETQRLNVNLADAASIAKEIALAGLSPSNAAVIGGRIADYVDRDDVSFDGGSERERFAAAGAAAPKNGPLQLLEELRLVPGVDAETYRALGGVISIHSTRSDRMAAQNVGPGDSVAAPRGVYRITAVAGRVDGRTGRAIRTAVIEIDPARPFEPAIRVWARAPAGSGDDEARNDPTQIECRNAVLGP